MPQINLNQITNNSYRPIGRAQETIFIYYSSAIYFTPYNLGLKEDSNKETVVQNESDELRTSSHTINGLRWSDPVEGRTDTTNINKPNRGDGDRLLSDDGELGIWRDLVGKTL